MVKKIGWVVLLFLSLQALLFAVAPAAQPLKSVSDDLAADFTLLDLGKSRVSLSDFKDKPVILFFWTTWCPFCLNELKMLNNIYAEMTKDGVELLAINAGEPFYKVDNFAKRYNLAFRVLLDEDGEVSDSYGVMGVPTYIFIDKKGYIVSRRHSFSKKIYKDLILD